MIQSKIQINSINLGQKMEAKAIVTDEYLDQNEIEKHLEKVEYIVMAAPAPSKFKETPIHFTIFLNTPQNLPKEVQDAVFEKFLKENSIKNPTEIIAKVMPVGFAKSKQDTPMPLLLIKREDQFTIPSTPMFVFDFLADSDNFFEAKTHALTGWTYSYDQE